MVAATRAGVAPRAFRRRGREKNWSYNWCGATEKDKIDGGMSLRMEQRFKTARTGDAGLKAVGNGELTLPKLNVGEHLGDGVLHLRRRWFTIQKLVQGIHKIEAIRGTQFRPLRFPANV